MAEVLIYGNRKANLRTLGIACVELITLGAEYFSKQCSRHAFKKVTPVSVRLSVIDFAIIITEKGCAIGRSTCWKHCESI